MRKVDVTNIIFQNDGVMDETQFDTQNETELAQLWWEFCKENDLIKIEQGKADWNTGEMI